jgi:aspartyl protease family protein
MKNIICFFLFAVLMVACDRPKRNTSSSNVTEITEREQRTPRKIRTSSGNSGNNDVKMKPMGGVYEIPIKINGVNMDIIFDTGASNISISETEVRFLWKQGKLDEDDILGSMQFKDATGKISEGTVINLRAVQIGNRVIKDVEASVVHNSQAPLLLGQSALALFGKVTIDYNKNILSFE